MRARGPWPASVPGLSEHYVFILCGRVASEMKMDLDLVLVHFCIVFWSDLYFGRESSEEEEGGRVRNEKKVGE